jgi:hypothetical protein
MDGTQLLSKLFLCVGAQKAAITWLYAQLQDHRKLRFAEAKEIHYFDSLNTGGSKLIGRRRLREMQRALKLFSEEIIFVSNKLRRVGC